VLAGVALAACNGQAAAPARSPGGDRPSPSPEVRIVLRAPAADILSDGEVGLPRTGGSDHKSLTQAAGEQQNQPLALIRYRAWGWVDQAGRSWGGGQVQVSESLLLLTKVDGARLAYFDYANEVRLLPQPVSCPPGLGLDDCTEGRSGPAVKLAGRVGPYVVRLEVSGAEVDSLAAKQAVRIRG
jgi:hypothetical protein